MRRSLAISCLAGALLLVANSIAYAQAPTAPAATAPESSGVVRFVGELLRAENRPVSGVFRMTFALHTSQRSSSPVWSETEFVAVDIGSYTVDLGGKTPIPSDLFGKRAWLSVSVPEIGEVIRQEIDVRAYEPVVRPAPPAIAELAFAALADRALIADRARQAEDADRLGGKTLAEIDRYSEIHRLFVELRQQVNVIRSSGGTRVANRTSITERVGGNAGLEYRVTCPEGQVVVGINGRADQGVDSISLICAPLEHAR